MLLRLEHTPKLVIAAINDIGGRSLEIAMAAISASRARCGEDRTARSELATAGTGGTQRSHGCRKEQAIELM